MFPTKFRFIWPSSFRGEEFKNQPIRNKSRLWRPCLLPDRDQMSNLYRGSSIDASYQVSVHLAQRFQRRIFFKNLYRDNCILNTDIYIQTRVIFLLTEEKISQKSTNQKQELPVVAMFVNGSGRNEQFLQRTFHRCFLQSFGSFGKVVSEKILRNRPIRNKNCLWRPRL